MKKLKKLLLTAGILVLSSILSFAQMDERAPGLYSVVDGNSTQLTFLYGKSAVEGRDLHGVEVTSNTFIFNGETSGISADSTFVLVLDPQLNKPVKKMKEYIPFIKSMSPTKIILVPFKVNKEEHRREFYQGLKYDQFRSDKRGSIKFAWKKISDNSFEINARALPPGEYGFIFKTEAVMGYDYTAVFGFTVPDTNTQQTTESNNL